MQSKRGETSTTDPELQIRYCTGHKTKHGEEGWRWTKEKGKYWCSKCFYCNGCLFVHPIDGYLRITTDPETGKTIRLCNKWSKPTQPSIQKKMQNMSPEEVMSGVQYGNERASYFGKDTEDFSKVQKQQVKALKDAL